MKNLYLFFCLIFISKAINGQGFDSKTDSVLNSEFVNVVKIVKELIQQGNITIENSKTGITNVYYTGGKYPLNFRFQGIIDPTITGVIKFNEIYFDPSRKFSESEKDKITDPINIEYIISNDSIKSIHFIDQEQTWNTQYFVLINDKNIKIINEKKGTSYSDGNRREYFIDHYSKNDIALSLMSYCPKSLQGETWYNLFSSLFNKVYRSVIIGNLISSNIDLGMYGNEGIIDAQNEKCILTKKSWTTFQDLKNVQFQYHEADIKENDTLFIFSSLINVEKKRFKYECFIDKTVKTEYWYSPSGDIIEMVDKQQILTLFNNSKYKSNPKPTRYNPLVFSLVKDKLTNSVLTKVMVGNKILAEGNIKYDLKNRSIVGQLKTYSIKANLGNGIEAKIALTCQQPIQDFIRNSSLKNFASPADFMPNQFNTNETTNAFFYKSLYIDPSPLATTPLGRFDPKSRGFIDPSSDYLYQKIEFADMKDEKGAVLLAYQYLPGGIVFDSINKKLNDFGEQIGKSKFKDYPQSKEYASAFNKKLEQSVDEGSFNLLYNAKKSKEIAKYCSYCSKPFSASQQGILTKMEFPCSNTTIVSDVIYKFCGFKCYDEYRKSICETNH